jgi:uncharacterized protein YjbJ (UPF0337 family)
MAASLKARSETKMNKFMWILGATCLGAAAYVLFSDQLATGARQGYGANDLGSDVGQWGTKQRVKGSGGVLGGKLKQGFGKLTGDDQTESEGYADEVGGRLKDAAGQAAHAVSDTIAELNK